MRHQFHYSFKNRKAVCFDILVRIFPTYLNIDTSRDYNLVDPCFLKNFYEKHPPTAKMLAEHESSKNFFGSYKPPLYFYEGVIEKKGSKTVVCTDGQKRRLKCVYFSFTVNGQEFKEEMFIDKSICGLNKNLETPIGALMGREFLTKHKLVVDFDREEIYSSGYYD